MSESEIHFAQHLASNEVRIRDKALKRLQKWIRLRSQSKNDDFSEDGMTKLWKGLFYCMWMADKPLVQEELADNISALIHLFAKPSQSYLFIGGFFRTMGRNHDNIDKFRIDKFLMFARRFFRASLQYVKARDWEHKHVQHYLEVLRKGVLSQKHEPAEMALGFRLHFLDIFLEELARAGEGQMPQKRAHNFLEPMYEILAYCKSPMMVEGVRDKVFRELLRLTAASLDPVESDGEEDDEESEDEVVVNGKQNGRSKAVYGKGKSEEVNGKQMNGKKKAEVSKSAKENGEGARKELRKSKKNGKKEGEKLKRGKKRNRKEFLEEEAELDSEAEDSEGGNCEVSEDEDEEYLAKRRRTDKGFVVDDDAENSDDAQAEDEEDDGDLEERLIREQETEAEIHLYPIDFDLTSIKNSIRAYMKVEGLKAMNRKALQFIVKKIIDIEGGVNPFALSDADSCSELELDEEELKRAEKRLKLLERGYAQEADENLIPERDQGYEDFDEYNDDFEVS